MADAQAPPPGQAPIGPLAAGLALLLAALWGGTPVAVKFSLDALPVMAVAAVRFAMAALFMLFWNRFEGSGIALRPGQARPCLVLGGMLFVQIALFNFAIAKSNASHSTLIINTFIFWVAALEHFVTRTARLDLRKTAGLLVAFSGVGIILLTTGRSGESAADTSASLTGDLLMVGSAIVLGVKIIYTKQSMRIVEPGKLIFWHDAIGVALFAAWSATFEAADLAPFLNASLFTDSRIGYAMLGLLYQGVVVAGFCFAAQALLLKKHSASQISVFSFATPLFGVMYAVTLRGEALSGWLFVSGIAVAAGILLVNWPEKSASKSEDNVTRDAVV